MHTMESLFGVRSAIASIDLPGHLEALAARIPPERGLNVDRIIDSLTLFPYYAAFEPPAVRARLRRAMAEGRVRDLHLCLGIAAYRVARVTTLRFCPVCHGEMLESYGEFYWRRDHQLPSVLVCPDHECVLRESTVSLSRQSRHAFVAAKPENCPRAARPLVSTIEPSIKVSLQKLAHLSADLLEHPGNSRTFGGWTTYYRARMRDVGLAKSPSTMNQQQLSRDFSSHYGAALQYLTNVINGETFVGDWLPAMVRTHRKAIHPMYHLLLQNFFDCQKSTLSPFDPGPWPCLNPLAKHRSKFPVKECCHHRNRGNSVGVFSCSCGYVYTRCFNPITRQLGPPRFQRYGPLLEPALRRMLAVGTSLRGIARQLRLNPKTVASLAQELHIPVTWSLRPSRKPGIKRNSSVANKMTMQSPDKKPRKPRDRARPRRNWTKIDMEWSIKIKMAEREILRAVPPVRVTLAELERRIGTRGWLGKRRGKLPRTSVQIARLLESVEAFQSRRIHWAIAALERVGGEPARAWQVMRKAGLHAGSLPLIRSVLDARAATSPMVDVA